MNSQNVPAFRQSISSSMGCENCYRLTQIDGVKFPSGPEADRGVDIHAILAPYARHCAQHHVPADFAYLDSLCDAVGDEAFTILENCRDNLTIDWQNFFEAEIHFGMDEDFRPTFSYDHDGKKVEVDPVWGIEGSGREPAYCGILDVLYVMPGGRVAKAPDYKSHNRPFPADTDQGKLYTLAVLMHLPELQECEFSLRFVRYANVVTAHKYTRQDVPALMAAMKRKRAQQEQIHHKVETGEPLRVHGGPHCSYCPCILNPDRYPCPIEPLNPSINRTPAEWLSTKLVLDTMKWVADNTLKQTADQTREPIRSQDANGKWYIYQPEEREVVTAWLFEEDGKGGFDMPIVNALLDWANENSSDLVPRRGSKPWFCNLKIGWSKLHSYLKSNKREIIHNRIRDLATIEKRIQYKITKDAEIDDGPVDESYSEEGEETEF